MTYMRTSVPVAALIASALVLSNAASALAQPAPRRCPHDTFAVGGQAVAVTVCADASDGGKTVAVIETFKNAASSFNLTTSIEVINGAVASRAVHDVSLAPLGLQYTLPLTLAYRERAVYIEHALLLPGAVPLK